LRKTTLPKAPENFQNVNTDKLDDSDVFLQRKKCQRMNSKYDLFFAFALGFLLAFRTLKKLHKTKTKRHVSKRSFPHALQ
jgi:hypothetical protein